MGNDVRFPTVGELLRFAYRVAGVLPEKDDPILPRGRSRAATRKAIARLAQEEGTLEENLGELAADLSFLIAGYSGSLPAHMLVGDVLGDVLESYQELIASEGTFLDRQSTLKWLIRDRWLEIVVVSLARNAAKCKPSMLFPFRPDATDWFLPDFMGDGVVWPLRKALEWLYATVDLSQTQFHYPGRDATESNHIKQRDLENAQNWTSGRSLPSAAALKANLSRAIHERAEPIKLLTDPRRLSYVESVIFLSRVSTAIWREIVEIYGVEFASEVRKIFYRLWEQLMDEMGSLEGEMAHHCKRVGVRRSDPALRRRVLSEWGRSMDDRLRFVQRAIEPIVKAGIALEECHLGPLREQCGSLAVDLQAIPLMDGHLPGPPPHFLELYGEWCRLRESTKKSAEDIDFFEQALGSCNLADALCWMPPWLRFQLAYRQQNYATAWLEIGRAYELAKYRAGRSQYEIVNQYVEMAAKCGTHQEFVGGVKWARYIGLKIRWIRGRDLAPDNLEFAKAMFRNISYAV